MNEMDDHWITPEEYWKCTEKPQLTIGDKIQRGTPIQDGSIFWGSIQIVKKFSSEGFPMYRARYGKVDKIAEIWRIPVKPDRLEERNRA
jgi:hypothetical protein